MDGAWQTTVAVQIKSLTGLLVFILTATILDCVCVCVCVHTWNKVMPTFSAFSSPNRNQSVAEVKISCH